MPRSKIKHKKFQKLDGDDGWTHVVRGPRLPSNELHRTTDNGVKLSKLKTASVLSLDQIQNKHFKSQQYWAEDPLRNRFKEIFESKIVGSSDIVIENAIVLGLGSLASDNIDSSSMHQLVLFEYWIQFLRTTYPISKIYFQDPHFHANDRLFLTERGYNVVEDPKAYLLFTPNTLFFAPYLPWQVTHTFLYVAFPVLFAGNNINIHDTSTFQPERQLVMKQSVVKEFYGSREWESLDGRATKESLNGQKHAQWLHDIVVYWPRVSSIPDSNDLNEEHGKPMDTSERLFAQDSPTLQTYHPSQKISFRVGPGEWRDDGYVFDQGLQEEIHAVQTAERHKS